MPHTRRSTIAALCGLVVAGCSIAEPPQEPLPPLLANATAGGGWDSACPARNDSERAMMAAAGKVATSPEITQRLRQQFPAGSAEADLTRLLASDGFDAPLACESDPTIRHAGFFRKGTGFLPYDAIANVFWKVDADGRIAWTQGSIFYQGL